MPAPEPDEGMGVPRMRGPGGDEEGSDRSQVPARVLGQWPRAAQGIQGQVGWGELVAGSLKFLFGIKKKKKVARARSQPSSAPHLYAPLPPPPVQLGPQPLTLGVQEAPQLLAVLSGRQGLRTGPCVGAGLWVRASQGSGEALPSRVGQSVLAVLEPPSRMLRPEACLGPCGLAPGTQTRPSQSLSSWVDACGLLDPHHLEQVLWLVFLGQGRPGTGNCPVFVPPAGLCATLPGSQPGPCPLGARAADTWDQVRAQRVWPRSLGCLCQPPLPWLCSGQRERHGPCVPVPARSAAGCSRGAQQAWLCRVEPVSFSSSQQDVPSPQARGTGSGCL